MAIKMVASDLDLTLLNRQYQVTPEVKTVARQLVATGVQLVLVSGRMYPAAARVAQQLELDVPIISYNGGSIKRGISGQVLFEKAVPHEIAVACTEYGLTQGLVVQLYVNDVLYTKEKNPYSDYYGQANGIAAEIQPDLLSLLDKGDSMKILYMGTEEQLAKAAKDIQGQFPEEVYITTSHRGYMDILPAQVNKGSSLQKVAALFDIAPAEILAIGDNLNDIPLLQTAGFGVAMGNAVPELKEVADAVTGDTDEGGWCAAMKQYVLQPGQK